MTKGFHKIFKIMTQNFLIFSQQAWISVLHGNIVQRGASLVQKSRRTFLVPMSSTRADGADRGVRFAVQTRGARGQERVYTLRVSRHRCNCVEHPRLRPSRPMETLEEKCPHPFTERAPAAPGRGTRPRTREASQALNTNSKKNPQKDCWGEILPWNNFDHSVTHFSITVSTNSTNSLIDQLDQTPVITSITHSNLPLLLPHSHPLSQMWVKLRPIEAEYSGAIAVGTTKEFRLWWNYRNVVLDIYSVRLQYRKRD